MAGIEGFDAAEEDMNMQVSAQAGEGEVCRTIKVRPCPRLIPLRDVVTVQLVEPEPPKT